MSASTHVGSQLVDLCSVLLLLCCFAIVAQRRLSVCVDLFAPQSAFLAATAALVVFTGHTHIYVAAAPTIVIKVIVLPRILRKGHRAAQCFASWGCTSTFCWPAACEHCDPFCFITQPIIPLGYLLTRDSLAIALAIILIGFFTMIARQKAITQMVGFLVMENGCFWGDRGRLRHAVDRGIGDLFDVLVVGLIVGIYTHRLQDTFDKRRYEHAYGAEGMIETMTCELRVGDACGR